MNNKMQVATTSSTGVVASVVTDGGPMSVGQIKANRALIKEVMQSVMEEGKHYGTVKGTDKPMLLKPGSELLCSLFQLDAQPAVEDLSTADGCIRYRIIMKAVHIPTGVSVGHGVGECSSDEEKYRWRRARSIKEWEHYDSFGRARVKYDWGGDEIDQVKTEPADAANTILKMASKRAKSDMVLAVLAVSDIFGQDAEEMAEWMKENEGTAPPQTNKQRSTQPPKPKSGVVAADLKINASQLQHLRMQVDQIGVAESIVAMHFNVDSIEVLPFAQLNAALSYLKELKQEPPQ